MAGVSACLDLLPVLGAFQTVLLSSFIAVILATVINRFATIRYPDEIPRVREPKGSTGFSLRTRLAYYTDAKALFQEAYEQYSRHGKTCLMPGLGFRTEVLIPNSSIRWSTSQPDSVLSGSEAAIELDQVKYSVGHRKYFADSWQADVLKRDLNTSLESLSPTIYDELGVALRQRFGNTSSSWNSIDLYRMMKLVVAQASSRFTVSLPLCRDETYLKHNIAFGDWFVIEAGALGMFPRMIRPIVAPFLTWPMKYLYWRISRRFRATYDERMKLLESPPSKDVPEPQDHLQMMLRFAQKNRPGELSFQEILPRLAVSNIGSIHQTSIAITNLLYNIIESDTRYNTISLLREEITQCLPEQNGKWSKAGAAKMIRCDSVMRETLRLNSFGNRGVLRQVMVDDLVTEDGFLLPKGAQISCLGYPSQTDSSVYENGEEFDPFRFSRPRELAEPGMSTVNTTFVSTGPRYLAFGHGKHACPGRFILDFELKMMISRILLDYYLEFPKEYKGKRPPLQWVAEAQMLPSDGRILVKRREVLLSE